MREPMPGASRLNISIEGLTAPPIANKQTTNNAELSSHWARSYLNAGRLAHDEPGAWLRAPAAGAPLQRCPSAPRAEGVETSCHCRRCSRVSGWLTRR
jgi:hypothetical protein